MTSGIHEPQADENTGQTQKGCLEFCETIQTATQPSKRMQPSHGALRELPEHAQADAVGGVPRGQHRRDPAPPQALPQGFGVIAPVALQALRLPARWSRFAAHRGHGSQHLLHLRDLVH
jgi:hypothetical protein